MTIFELQPGIPAPWIQAYMWERNLYPFCVNVGLFRAAGMTIKPEGIPVLLWALLSDGLYDDMRILYDRNGELGTGMGFAAIVPSSSLIRVESPLTKGTFVQWKTPKGETLRGFFEEYIPPGVQAAAYLPKDISTRCSKYKVSKVRFQPSSVKKHMRGLIVQRTPTGHVFYAVDVRKLVRA